jgi:hypothetical protein
MRDELVCRTCETGRLQPSPEAARWLAGMFGRRSSSCRSRRSWSGPFGLFGAFGLSRQVLSEVVPILGAWLVTSLPPESSERSRSTRIGARVPGLRAITHALEEDEGETLAWIDKSAAARAHPNA